MLNIREKTLKNILSVVEDKKMAAALGEKRLISMLGEEKVIAALGDKKIVAALLKNKQLLRSLLSQLDAEELRGMLARKNRN